MERAVFVIAVTFAIIFGIVAFVGGPHMNFGNFGINIDDDHDAEAVLTVAPGQMAAQTFQGASLKIEHAAAIITITPEDRADISVEITNPGHAPMPTVTTDDGRVTVDGHLRGRISNCREDGVSLRGYGIVAPADLPQITIHTPRALTVGVSGASTTTIGAAQSVDANLSGCGLTNIGDVAETLTLQMAGSGDVHTGAAHALNATIAGSSDVTTGAVADGAQIAVAGSGGIELASVTGPLKTTGAGSGSINIHGGSITTAKIDLAASGDVDIAAPVQSLDVSIVGSGDVDVAGAVGDIDAEIMGSGSVSVASASGSVHKRVMGSGDVNIGH